MHHVKHTNSIKMETLDIIYEVKKRQKRSQLPKLSEFPVYDELPEDIINALKYQTNSMIKKKALTSTYRNEAGEITNLIDPDTGEVFQQTLTKYVNVDTNKFVKVFVSAHSAFHNLTPSGSAMFLYFLGLQKINDIKLVFNPKQCRAVTGLSKQTMISGIRSLVHARVIFKTSLPQIYLSNPLVMFNGTLSTFVQSVSFQKGD